MPSNTIIHNGHKIEIQYSYTGKEKVFYDGRLMSDKFTIAGGTHIFKVEENGEAVQYETNMGAWWGLTPKIEVRRNGVIIFTNR